MKSLVNTAWCLALGVFFMVAGFQAAAQTITLGANSATCQVSPTATGLTYTFAPDPNASPTQTFSYWATKGDLEITSTSSSGTTSTATVKSTGYGRGQIIAFYSVGGCNPVPLPYEVNKSFTTTEPVIGPTCVLPNAPYTWSINPIISTATQIAAQIGIDKYVWTVASSNATLATTLQSQLNQSTAFSGDGSAIRLTMPTSLVDAFTLKVQVGTCNQPGPSILVTPTPPTPVISGPSCRPTSDTSPFTLSTSSVIGVTYTWNVPPTWSISPAAATVGQIASGTTVTVTVTPDNNGGDVTVTASNGGGCGSPTGRYTLKRQLDPAVAQITGEVVRLTERV